MTSEPALIQVRVNRGVITSALIDSGCDCYAAISQALASRLRLPLVDRRKRPLRGYSEYTQATKTSGVAALTIETGGYIQKIYAYVILGLGEDLFLKKPWCARNDVTYHAKERRLSHREAGVKL